jgi:small-conductance mechanosensitive channel
MDVSLILDQLRERLAGLGLQLLDFIPNLITALLVMLLGWLLAWLSGRFINRVGTSLVGRLAAYDFVGVGLDRGLGGSLPRIMARVAYWALLLVFAAVAVDQLGVDIITDLFTRLAQYLPNVVLAALIVFAGIVLGNGARSAAISTAETAGIDTGATLGRLVQAGVVTAAALVAADQIGVESTLLVVVFAITVGTTMGGLALAFGIGAGPMVSNMIAGKGVRKIYRVGQSVRIGSIEGRILEIGATSVTIEAPDGAVHVPATTFAREISVSLREG